MGQRTDRINPNGAPQMNFAQLHTFAEQEYRRMRRHTAASRRQDAETFCDRLISEGRFLPHQKHMLMMPLLLGLDDSASVWQFSDRGVTKVLTSYELKKAQMAKSPIIVRAGERPPHDPNNKQAAQDEVNKVERFCEMFGEKLKIHIPEYKKKTIDQAKKMAERNPGFKAADLIGEGAARMIG
jgi:hypothetical protein